MVLVPHNDQLIRSLLEACRETNEEEIDCDQFLSVMPEYAEACAILHESEAAAPFRLTDRHSAGALARPGRKAISAIARNIAGTARSGKSADVQQAVLSEAPSCSA